MPNSVVHCPKCNSNQLTTNKKGFSGRKAVAGAVVTGGIGLLAGTIGSNKVVITCLTCGHKFKPGEGIAKTDSHTSYSEKPVQQGVSETIYLDRQIARIVTDEGLLAAIKATAKIQGIGLEAARGYVDDLVFREKLTPSRKNSGCAGIFLLAILVLGLIVLS